MNHTYTGFMGNFVDWHAEFCSLFSSLKTVRKEIDHSAFSFLNAFCFLCCPRQGGTIEVMSEIYSFEKILYSQCLTGWHIPHVYFFVVVARNTYIFNISAVLPVPAFLKASFVRDFTFFCNSGYPHSKNHWVVLTQHWVKYGQPQPLGYVF